MAWLLRRSSRTGEWLRRAARLLVMHVQRWGWKSIVVLVGALIGAALALDVDAALTNAITEAASVLAGVAITVYILDRRQRRREREREGELRRSALARELSWNLTKMMRRRKNVLMPNHRYISLVMKDIALSVDDLAKPVYINEEQTAQLVSGFGANIRFDEVKTDAMKSILDSGLAPDTMAHGYVGEAIGRLVEDVEHLRRLELVGATGDWRTELAIPGARTVAGGHLATAYHYHNTMENIFNGHVAVLRWPIGNEYSAPARQPLTPLEDVEQAVAAERVSPDEVLTWVKTGRYPFD